MLNNARKENDTYILLAIIKNDTSVTFLTVTFCVYKCYSGFSAKFN